MTVIEIINESNFPIQKKPLLKAATQTINYEAVHKNIKMTILITTNEKIRQLNREYREVDSPTDVLSFNLNFQDPVDDSCYLGDIIISYPAAMAQAQKNGFPVIAELQLLVVHGTLHLLGYDHELPEKKLLMWQKQKAILEMLGLANIAPK